MLTRNEQQIVVDSLLNYISPHENHIEATNRRIAAGDIERKLKKLFAAVEQITGVLPDAEPAPAPKPALPQTQTCGHVDYSDKHSFAGRFFCAVQNILGDEITHANMSESFDATGVDDLDRIEMVLALEEEFEMEIPDYSVDNFKSFADMFKFIKDRFHD